MNIIGASRSNATPPTAPPTAPTTTPPTAPTKLLYVFILVFKE